MALKRLCGMSLLTAWQLFTSMVSPVVKHASDVYMYVHECKFQGMPAINKM